MTKRAYVLMTAMPPTKGHARLIEFAAHLGRTVEVILCTQPDEPFVQERYDALVQFTRRKEIPAPVNIHWINRELPQEPEGHEGFWDMWSGFLTDFGIQTDDYIVASERYGIKLAEITGAIFMPYDIDRELYYSKATRVREDPYVFYSEILPEFQRYVQTRVTIFGAESTGKTTLSRRLAKHLNGQWAFEYARPYLETVGNDINVASMTAIWQGQRALQEQMRGVVDAPFVIQDTDLFSTVGYWDHSLWAGREGQKAPNELIADAVAERSDLYIITTSNIPFEHDQLRYGGDHREIPDNKWIELAEMYGLNYVVLNDSVLVRRLAEAERLCVDFFYKKANLTYQRVGEEYANV